MMSNHIISSFNNDHDANIYYLDKIREKKIAEMSDYYTPQYPLKQKLNVLQIKSKINDSVTD